MSEPAATAAPEDQVHVLAVIQGAAYGGAHNQVVRLHERLRERGFTTSVLMTDEPGSAADRLRAEGVDLQTTRLRRIRATRPVATAAYLLTFWPQVQRLRAHIRAAGATVVQAHGVTNIDVAVAGRLEGAAVVWQVLDTRAPVPLRWVLSPAVVALADSLLVTGTTILMAYPGLRRAADSTHPYFPPVDDRSEEEVSAARRRGRGVLGLADGDVAVGCLANLNPQKGHDRLITAFAASGVAGTARLFVRGAASAGHERYRRTLADLVVEQGLPPETLGALGPDLPAADFVAALDVFCLSAVGRSEGTPTVVIEAMQAAVPVVTTAAGGVVDLVDDGVQGLVTPVDDRGALARAIARLVVDGASRRRMGAAARERAQRELSIHECEAAYVRAYVDALDRRSRRAASVRR